MKSESIARMAKRGLLERRKAKPRNQQKILHRFLIAATIGLVIMTIALPGVDAFSEPSLFRARKHIRRQQELQSPRSNPSKFLGRRRSSAASTSVSDDEIDMAHAVASFDQAVKGRYACTRYARHDGNYNDDDDSKQPKRASPADPQVLQLAREALELSTRAPTGFNAQPYKLLLVESVAAKEALSKYCIGRNRDRVLDSDCTVLFLADRQAMSSWKDYKNLLLQSKRNQSKSALAWLKLRTLVALFSNGIPLPKLLAGPISFGIRLAMRVVSWFSRAWLVVPTLSSPECWSQKNTMLVAMSYMLGCSARGLDTTPMEGYLSWGVRQSLKIPRRYTIPLMVSTGRAYQKKSNDSSESSSKDGEDDAGMSHGTSPDTATPRFPMESVLYENGFP